MGMQIRDIANKLNASVLTPELDMSREVIHAFSSDLMSDVLTGDHYKTVLLTGLSNLQALRTAEMFLPAESSVWSLHCMKWR
jgi:hypothetical protein